MELQQEQTYNDEEITEDRSRIDWLHGSKQRGSFGGDEGGSGPDLGKEVAEEAEEDEEE